MEIKKTTFSERPALIEPEGSVARINFDIEEVTEVINQGEGNGEEETRTVYLAHIVRVEQPLTFDRIKAAMVEKGFDDDKAEEQTAMTLLALVQGGQHVGNELELARRAVIARISAYDKSDAVNQFSYNGVPMWLDKETRNGLIARLNAEKAVCKTTSTLWLGTQSFTITPDAGLQMLAALEVYASECYDKTAEHKAAVAALDDVSAILNYDIEDGYPQQPTFGE
jgi:hypothetical protein